MSQMSDDEKKQIYKSFYEKVNLQPKELEQWLQTDESKTVGDSSDGDESTGHASGRRIVTIKRKKKDELTNSDYKHMKKVTAYIKRHRAQEPSGSIEDSNWRYSLMNWGHDPLK